MINRLSNPINRNRSAAKISKVMSSRSYITLARILEDYEKCALPGFGDVPGARCWHLASEFPGARCPVPGDKKGGQLGYP